MPEDENLDDTYLNDPKVIPEPPKHKVPHLNLKNLLKPAFLQSLTNRFRKQDSSQADRSQADRNKSVPTSRNHTMRTSRQTDRTPSQTARPGSLSQPSRTTSHSGQRTERPNKTVQSNVDDFDSVIISEVYRYSEHLRKLSARKNAPSSGGGSARNNRSRHPYDQGSERSGMTTDRSVGSINSVPSSYRISKDGPEEQLSTLLQRADA